MRQATVIELATDEGGLLLIHKWPRAASETAKFTGVATLASVEP